MAQRRKPKEPKVNGILIQMTGSKDGQELHIAPLGNVKKTELPALLGIAKRVAEQDLGI